MGVAYDRPTAGNPAGATDREDALTGTPGSTWDMPWLDDDD
jgi:hypothetical protein